MHVTKDPDLDTVSYKKNGRRNHIVGFFILFFALLGLMAAVAWWFVFRNFETTEDAYVGGNLVLVTARQEGSVIAFYADDTDFVEEGQLLVEIDPTDYLLAFEEKKIALESAARHAHAANDLRIDEALINAKEAFLALKRCSILAPASGFVAKRNVQIGQAVKVAAPLMAIIPLDNIWIEANFKETQLKNIRIGQDVEAIADMYGDSVIYHGKVGGIQGGSGSIFSLLPPQNASGNWIKIIQRVPVRIYLDPKEVEKHPLFLGLSIHAKVDVSDKSGHILAKQIPVKAVMKTDVFEVPFEDLDAILGQIVENNLGLNSKPESL